MSLYVPYQNSNVSIVQAYVIYVMPESVLLSDEIIDETEKG